MRVWQRSLLAPFLQQSERETRQTDANRARKAGRQADKTSQTTGESGPPKTAPAGPQRPTRRVGRTQASTYSCKQARLSRARTHVAEQHFFSTGMKIPLRQHPVLARSMPLSRKRTHAPRAHGASGQLFSRYRQTRPRILTLLPPSPPPCGCPPSEKHVLCCTAAASADTRHRLPPRRVTKHTCGVAATACALHAACVCVCVHVRVRAFARSVSRAGLQILPSEAVRRYRRRGLARQACFSVRKKTGRHRQQKPTARRVPVLGTLTC